LGIFEGTNAFTSSVEESGWHREINICFLQGTATRALDLDTDKEGIAKVIDMLGK